MRTMAVKKNTRIHPQKFLLWLALASIVMMFAGLTSAYIVRRAAGNWVDFKLPDLFQASTIVILLSSLTMAGAVRAFRNEKRQLYSLMLGLTLLLGSLFTFLQYKGWQELMGYGILLEGNPSGSFLYIISGVHAAHIIGGLVFLVIFFFKSLYKRDIIQKLMEETNPDNSLSIELMATYWHFVDVLWIYLFVFLLYNQ